MKIWTNKVYLILLLIAFSFIVFLSVVYEISEAKDDLLKILKDESITLIEALSKNIENSIVTNTEIENVIIQKLNAIGELTAHLEGHYDEDSQYIRKVAGEFHVDFVALIGNDGRVDATNIDIKNDDKFISKDFLQLIKPLIEQNHQWLDLGNINDPINQQQVYMLARKRKIKSGFVLIGLSSQNLLEIRKRIGIGKLLQDIGGNPNIVYAVLQDKDGILAASNKVKELESIESQKFLENVWNSGKVSTRIKDYYWQDSSVRKVFEVVKRIPMNEDTNILIRIALSVETIRNIQQSSMYRAIYIGFGTLILGSLFIGLIYTYNRNAVLKEEYKQIQSYISIILNSVTDAVFAVDNNGIITVFNRSAESIFEFSSKEMIGHIYAKSYLAKHLNFDNEKLIENAGKYMEFEYTTLSGKKKILSFSLSSLNRIKNEKGDRELLRIVIVRDLTERKRITEQIQRKDKMTALGELAFGVAHEIRNPLNAIGIIAQRFHYEFEPVDDKEEYAQLTDSVRKEVNRVNNIITQFIEFSRPAELVLRKESITDLLDETIILLKSQADRLGIKIERKYSGRYICMADGEKMKQVFLNIIKNSLDSMQDGGTLICSVNSSEGHIIIEITDSGSGIKEEDKNKVFNMYYTTKPTGTGLGLSMSHQIITEHKGEIILESEYGIGTTMTIILPNDLS
jgi:two-component system sensor histidine kinase HydH